eukprot:363239-Chlamydomonas_euryale.AAC.10
MHRSVASVPPLATGHPPPSVSWCGPTIQALVPPHPSKITPTISTFFPKMTVALRWHLLKRHHKRLGIYRA